MKSVFNMDGPLFRVLSRLADLVILNVYFVIGCLPIFTIGTSLSAMYYVCYKMTKEEEGYLHKEFFKAYKQNFKQGSIMTLIFLLVGGVVGFDLYLAKEAPEALGDMAKPMLGLAYAGLILLFLVAEFSFPVLARYENTIKVTIKNAILMELSNILWLLLISVINCLLVILFAVDPGNFIRLMVIWILFGASVPAYLNSYIFMKIFSKYES